MGSTSPPRAQRPAAARTELSSRLSSPHLLHIADLIGENVPAAVSQSGAGGLRAAANVFGKVRTG